MQDETNLLEAWGDPVDTTEFLRDQPGYSYSNFYNSILGNATQIYDRDDGRFRPIYDNEIDLKILRAASWLLHAKVPMAQAWVNRLLDYTVGTGFDWTVEHESEAVQEFAKRILDRTLTDNKWTSQLERETYQREIVDGETLSSLEWHNGSVEIDLRECDELTEPANGRQLEDYFEIDGPVSWTFGVCTPRYRADKPIGYHCVRDQGGMDWDYIPVDRFCHWKRNVLGKAKRGVGDFYCPNVYLMRSDRVASNVGDSAAVQAAIAYIVEHAQATTGSQVSKGIAALANAYQGRTDSINGSTEKLMRARVSRLDVKHGQKYINGPMGQNNAPIYVQVMEALLRMAGTTHAFPEGMLTGSYANNNLASALVAESPFVQGRISEQLERAAKIQELFEKILAMFANGGAFTKYGFADWDALKFSIKVHIHPSKVVPQDPFKLTQALAMQKQNGWVSDKTAITELGRDFEVETSAMEEANNKVQSDISNRVFGESRRFLEFREDQLRDDLGQWTSEGEIPAAAKSVPKAAELLDRFQKPDNRENLANALKDNGMTKQDYDSAVGIEQAGKGGKKEAARAVTGQPQEFTTLYRGVDPSRPPNDHGVAGKGEYWSGSEEVAQAYAGRNGEVKTGSIQLKNPLVLNYGELNAMQTELYGKPLTGFEADLSEKFDKHLRDLGHDGVVLYDDEISKTIPQEVIKLGTKADAPKASKADSGVSTPMPRSKYGEAEYNGSSYSKQPGTATDIKTGEPREMWENEDGDRIWKDPATGTWTSDMGTVIAADKPSLAKAWSNSVAKDQAATDPKPAEQAPAAAKPTPAASKPAPAKPAAPAAKPKAAPATHDVAKDYHAFEAPHDELGEQDVDEFTKKGQAGTMALHAFVTNAFTEINENPNSKLSKAFTSEIKKIPASEPPVLYRVLGFESPEASEKYIKSLDGTQERTAASWTMDDPTAKGATPLNNIGLDVASQFGDQTVIVKYEKPKNAKDISFVYGKNLTPGIELVTLAGNKTKVTDVKRDGDRTIVTVKHQESAGRSKGTIESVDYADLTREFIRESRLVEFRVDQLRDDRGVWIDEGEIADAVTDVEKARELLDRTTEPDNRSALAVAFKNEGMSKEDYNSAVNGSNDEGEGLYGENSDAFKSLTETFNPSEGLAKALDAYAERPTEGQDAIEQGIRDEGIKLPDGTVLYRGLSLNSDAEVREAFKDRGRLKAKGLQSATTEKDVAEEFSGTTGPVPVMLNIKCESTLKVLPVKRSGQSEFVLSKNALIYIVTKPKKVNGVWNVDALAKDNFYR